MHRQYKLNQQAAQTDPLMTALSLSAYRVMSVCHRSHGHRSYVRAVSLNRPAMIDRRTIGNRQLRDRKLPKFAFSKHSFRGSSSIQTQNQSRTEYAR
jgi:hypothetical protein